MIESSTGDMRLVDFGFAKDLSRSQSYGQSNDRTYTKCGTPGYSAPEVLLQDEGSSVFNIRPEAKKKSETKQGQAS